MRTMVFENDILEGLVHAEIEADIWHHADDRG